MPTKTTKGVANKSHIRASSASSAGKLNLSAAFARNKSFERIKRNTSDVQQHAGGRNTSPYPPGRVSPTKRERTVVLQVETGDDDEWVSSESGAATPAEYDEEDVPPSPPEPGTTPRGGDLSPLPPAQISRGPGPPPQSRADLPRVDTVKKFTTHTGEDSPSSDYEGDRDPPTPTHHAPPAPAPTPAPRRPATRPPSMRSVRSSRPHPLIRTRSYAPPTPIVSPQIFPSTSPASSQPLDPSSAVTNSPSSENLSHSHVHAHVHSHSHTHSNPSAASAYQPRLRRQGSYSSVTSVATLPLPTTSAATASTTRVHGERQRTLSHASVSAALSSLTAARQPHPPSRPSSPVIPIAFPPINPRGEQVHVMIPPPLVPPHASATAHLNPILEALRRVMEARARAGR